MELFPLIAEGEQTLSQSAVNLFAGGFRMKGGSPITRESLDRSSTFHVPGLTYLVHTDSQVASQPAHWAMRWASLLSFYSNRKRYAGLAGSGRIDSVVLLNLDPLLSGFQESIMDIALRATTQFLPFSYRLYAPSVIYLRDLDAKTTCFQTAFGIFKSEVYFVDAAAADAWQSAAQQYLTGPAASMEKESQTPCPKYKHASIVSRDRGGDLQKLSARPLWNIQAVQDVVTSRGLTWDLAVITSSWPFINQAAMFRESHLIISVHSSQLVNVLFSQPNSAVIELMPHNFDNRVFQNIGLALGVDYHVIGNNPIATSSPWAAEALHKFPGLDVATCMESVDCRGLHRNLGVQANLTAFSQVLDSLLAKGCP